MQESYVNIFDSHCHYDDRAFDCDRRTVIEKLFGSCGVSCLVHAATDISSCLYGIEMSEAYPDYYTSVGFHPENLDSLPENYIELLEKLLSKSGKIVAVGEIGLDYHYEGFDKALQLEVFERQLDLASMHDLPVIIHSRSATEDTVSLLRRKKPKGVLHCFSGSYETACEVVSLGMYIGFTGALTFKNNRKAVRALDAVPKDKLLLETDCPYMAPEGFRGKRSDSSMIPVTAGLVADKWRCSTQEVLDITCANAERLFGIDRRQSRKQRSPERPPAV